MRLALWLIPAGLCYGAIGNVHVEGVTATQAVVSYTAPDAGPCTIQVSENSSLSPLVHDVDPAIFTQADQDNRPGNLSQGTSRVAVIGKRSSEFATAGNYAGLRHYSRALQAHTPHYGRVACGSDTAGFNFTTGNIPLGNTYGDPWLADPSHPGDQPWPETVGGIAPESFIDPLTGVLLRRLGTRGQNWGFWGHMHFGTAYNQGQMPCDTQGPWSNPCAIVSGNNGVATVGNSVAWLVLRPPLTNGNAWNGGYGSWDYGQPWTFDQFAVTLKGSVNSSAAANRQLDVCLSVNGGASCASQIQTVALGTKQGPVQVGQADTSQFGITPWLLDTDPRLNMQEASPHSGRGNVAAAESRAGHESSRQRMLTWTGGQPFSLYWTTGGSGRIRLSAKDDACLTPPAATTSQEFFISSFADGTHAAVAGQPPAGSNLYWCANNFAVMVRRHAAPTDGSAVTLQYAEMAAVESTSPNYPDNGAGTACFNKLVQNGYFCLYGGLSWINPTSGDNVYYGFMVGPGSNVGNPWITIGIIPAGESAVIDQTANQFTFYNVALDTNGGGPLVIRGVLNPPSIKQPAAPYGNGSQVGNANIKSTNTYSLSYDNGLTFTNMTPQVTAHQSVVEQMAAFDPTFKPAYFKSGPNGWNCSAAAMTAGVFFFSCESLGLDSPAWIFAFSPGDANPAHAGQPGGPRIIGALSTFNTPNGPVGPKQTSAVGRSLHAITETGETGWVQLQLNMYPAVNTSSMASVPAASPACAGMGIEGGGDCIEIDLDSYHAGGASGYEPYLVPPFKQFQFTGAPGELRTAELGDTACLSAGPPTSNCNWVTHANELLTLVKKNDGGRWIFRRGGFGAPLAIAKGPLTLWWQSIQFSIPPSGTTVNQSLAAYWNPLSGCNGAPDPHGECLIQDSNNTSGHGEWRDGGEAVATNVPAWGKPIYGWPTDYQTIVGSVPGILNEPFANVTPGQAPGVNYTSANPPFAGFYGAPWGFDAGSHPNSAGAAAPPAEAIRAFDNTPVQGGAFDPVFSHLTEQLYVATPGLVSDPDTLFGSGGAVPINRKLMATGASCGAHPLLDVSGPQSQIPPGASGSYTYCISRAKGECLAGSTVGQVYVNCPGVIWDRCAGSGIHGGTPLGAANDICVSNMGAAANVVRQFTLDHTDYKGAFTRTLVSATSRLRMVGGFENNRLLPDNSWLLFRAEWLNFNREEMWMAKMLPYPAPDSIDRTTFVPMVLNLKPPPGVQADNAVVQFGYAEYGGNCTTRREACLASSAIVGNPPFHFAGEKPAGAPCASSCTIAIPAISQRVLYYHVSYRDKSNAVVSAGPAQAVVVP